MIIYQRAELHYWAELKMEQTHSKLRKFNLWYVDHFDPKKRWITTAHLSYRSASGGSGGMGWYFASEQVPSLFTCGTQPVETLASHWKMSAKRTETGSKHANHVSISLLNQRLSSRANCCSLQSAAFFLAFLLWLHRVRAWLISDESWHFQEPTAQQLVASRMPCFSIDHEHTQEITVSETFLTSAHWIKWTAHSCLCVVPYCACCFPIGGQLWVVRIQGGPAVLQVYFVIGSGTWKWTEKRTHSVPFNGRF